MKKYFKYMPYALCVIQTVMPVLRVVFHVHGWRAVPVPAFGIIITTGMLISVIFVVANDHMFEPDASGKIFSSIAALLGLCSSGIMLDAGRILYLILAIVNAICCFLLVRYADGIRLLRFIAGLSTCIVIVMALGLIFFSDYWNVDYKVVSRYDSPDGRYTAEVIDADDITEGAQVRVRKNTVFGIPIYWIYDITRQLTNASGDAVPEYYTVEWIDAETLSINGYMRGF